MTEQYGKWALITGASSGIGKAYAYKLASLNVNLVLVARNKENLNEIKELLKKKYAINVEIFSCDLSKPNATMEVFTFCLEKNIRIDTLINNAGFATYGKLHTTDHERNIEQLMLNVVSLSSLTQLFLPAMVKNKFGIIINISSTASFQPVPYMSNYGASKSFVRSFTEALWGEYKDDGIKFLTVCPGATETNFFNVVNAKEASVGKRDTPENVVEESLKALRCNKVYIITGPVQNYFLSQLGRILSQKAIVKTTEKVMRPR